MSPWSELYCSSTVLNACPKPLDRVLTAFGYSALVASALNTGSSILVGMILPANGVLDNGPWMLQGVPGIPVPGAHGLYSWSVTRVGFPFGSLARSLHTPPVNPV